MSKFRLGELLPPWGQIVDHLQARGAGLGLPNTTDLLSWVRVRLQDLFLSRYISTPLYLYLYLCINTHI